jgi:hypothetical protein
MDPPTVDLQMLTLNLPENSQGVTDNMTNGKRKKFRDNPDIASNGKPSIQATLPVPTHLATNAGQC